MWVVVAVGWGGVSREGMHFSQSKNACLLNLNSIWPLAPIFLLLCCFLLKSSLCAFLTMPEEWFTFKGRATQGNKYFVKGF